MKIISVLTDCMNLKLYAAIFGVIYGSLIACYFINLIIACFRGKALYEPYGKKVSFKDDPIRFCGFIVVSLFMGMIHVVIAVRSILFIIH